MALQDNHYSSSQYGQATLVEKAYDFDCQHGDIKNFDPSEQFNTRRWLLRAFEVLKTAEKALIVLFEIEGWSVAELAGLLKKPEGTIKARLSRSRKKMRKAIIAYLPDRDKKSQTSEAGYALSKSTAINE